MCNECYSEKPRITPILKPEYCLSNHKQYICSTCGRCICIQDDDKRGVRRWNFPFKSLDIAILYIKTAQIVTESVCGIYEIIGNKGRKSYKIFRNDDDLQIYLKKNKSKQCIDMKPLFVTDEYDKTKKMEIRMLTKEEVSIYLQQQEEGA